MRNSLGSSRAAARYEKAFDRRVGGGAGPCRRLLGGAALLLLGMAFAGAAVERKAEPVGAFLVASSGMADLRFRESVVLITQRNEYGTAGVIVNRPTGLPLSRAFPRNPALENRSEPLYFGGPVSVDTILFLLRSPERPRDSIHVFEDVYLSTSLELLEENLTKGDFADRTRVFAGYAGWAPGQLQVEIARGDWYTTRGDVKAIFEGKPEGLWRELIERLTGHWVRRGVEAPRS